MNENYYNGKYNIIKPDMSLVNESFKIRQQELDNDEVFSGNLILKRDFDNLDTDKVFSLLLDDNLIYVVLMIAYYIVALLFCGYWEITIGMMKLYLVI